MTDPLKEALAWADEWPEWVVPFVTKNNPAPRVLAASVRSRDEEIARLRLKDNHDRCSAGLRSLLKTAEEEIAGLRKVVEAAKKSNNGDCGVGKGCGHPSCELSRALAATKTGRKL